METGGKELLEVSPMAATKSVPSLKPRLQDLQPLVDKACYVMIRAFDISALGGLWYHMFSFSIEHQAWC